MSDLYRIVPFVEPTEGNPIRFSNALGGFIVDTEGAYMLVEVVLDHEAAEAAVNEVFEMNVLTGVGFSESNVVNMVLEALYGVNGKPGIDKETK